MRQNVAVKHRRVAGRIGKVHAQNVTVFDTIVLKKLTRADYSALVNDDAPLGGSTMS